MLDIAKLMELMTTHGLVIRAIPIERTSTYEVRHADRYPNGEVVYMENFKRNMLKVTEKNSMGGKFIIAQKRSQDSIVSGWEWHKINNKTAFFDTIEDAVNSILGGVLNENS